MMFFGFAEVLMLALLASGGTDNDLVAMVPPRAYFEARQVRVSIDSMIDIALAEPKDGKAQIMQLSALRYLTEEADAFKKAGNYATNREAIELIAGGKKAQDKLGFAKEYAQRLLDKLDGKKPAAPDAKKATPLRDQAFAWFPADVSFVGALDLHGAGGLKGGTEAIHEILKIMPDNVKLQMYDAIEKTGNARLERIAFAYTEGTGKRDAKIYIRITGKASQDAVINLVQMLEGGRGGLQSKEIKNDKDVPITLLQNGNRPPVIMLVGNSDLLFVGHEGNAGDHEALAQEVLAVRGKKKPSAAEGKLKDQLAKVPDKAVGMLVGDLPEEFKRNLAREFDTVPGKVMAYVERTDKGLDFQGEAGLADAEAAGKLLQKIAGLRKDGIAELQKAMQQPPRPGAPAIPFQGLINLMESMQVQGQGDKVSVRVVVPNGLIQQLPLLLMPRQVEFGK